MKNKYLCIFFLTIFFVINCKSKIEDKDDLKISQNEYLKQNKLVNIKAEPIVDVIFQRCFKVLDSLVTVIDGFNSYSNSVNRPLKVFPTHLYKKIIINDSKVKFHSSLKYDEVILFIISMTKIYPPQYEADITGLIIGYSKSDLKKWKTWYAQNKHKLKWDYKNHKIVNSDSLKENESH